MANPPSWCWPPVPAPACGRTPRRCCTRWPAAACSSHALHSVAKVAPQHLVVVLGHDRDRIAPGRRRAGRRRWAAPIDIAVQEQQLGTGHAVGCGLAALPADFAGDRRGDLRRRPAAGRRHAGRPDRHPQHRNRRGDGADDDAARPDGLRPHPAHPGPRGHRHRRAGRRHPSQQAITRGQRRRLRLRHRRCCARR